MLMKTRSGLRIKCIGDPHLGRSFTVGTAPHRRGEREESQFLQLAQELMTPNCDINIMMGDIFDKFKVDPTVVMKTYEIYASAALANPRTEYVLLRGNHDVSRDASLFSSFDLLSHMLETFTNVIVVEDIGLYTSRDMLSQILLFGYDPFRTSSELLELSQLEDRIDELDAAFGHWDTESYGGDDHNLCPYFELSQYTDTIVTGHEHNPREFHVDGFTGKKIPAETSMKYENSVKVHVVGSMQPYTHGEDKDEFLYVSRTLEQYQEEVEKDPEVYHNKCLRLLVKQGEELPSDIDCLQFTYKVVSDDGSKDLELDVDTSTLDMEKTFKEVLRDHAVEEDMIVEFWNAYLEKRANAE